MVKIVDKFGVKTGRAVVITSEDGSRLWTPADSYPLSMTQPKLPADQAQLTQQVAGTN